MHQGLKISGRRFGPALGLLAVAALLHGASVASAQDAVLKSQAERVAVVAKVKPTVVAVFAAGGGGGGTGVLISDEGYALTNFHVVQPAGPTMKCGLADGVLYDAVLVAQDKVGDVALIKLLAPKPGFKFPFAPMANSELVREGDWSLAMGNPFLLATDFTPTVTFGLISGVHRYQYPAGAILEYTDCIQIDTSINPGNSGGPLYNMKGEIIGINGRGSFDKRGRVNSGVGYAISINQIKNFLGHLMAGIETDHASLGALVATQTEDIGLGRIIVTSILENSDVARRGLDLDDQMVSFAGRPIGSVNQYKNVLGIFPRGWRVPMEFRHEGSRKEILVRLMGAIPKEIAGGPAPKKGGPKPGIPGKKGPSGPGAKFYDPKPGFTNHYFNRVEKDRLMSAFKKHGDFSGLTGDWSMEGSIRLKKLTSESPLKINLSNEGEGLASISVGGIPYTLRPFKDTGEASRRAPEESGGLLAALWTYKGLLTLGEKAFTSDEFHHGGFEPFYPPPAEGKEPAKKADWRYPGDTEVINAKMGNYFVKYFFSRADQKLLGFEMRVGDENSDPCEVFFSDYRNVDGRQLPHRMQVTYANGHYGTLLIDRYQMKAVK